MCLMVCHSGLVCACVCVCVCVIKLMEGLVLGNGAPPSRLYNLINVSLLCILPSPLVTHPYCALASLWTLVLVHSSNDAGFWRSLTLSLAFRISLYILILVVIYYTNDKSSRHNLLSFWQFIPQTARSLWSLALAGAVDSFLPSSLLFLPWQQGF